jgi:hypothetical protein
MWRRGQINDLVPEIHNILTGEIGTAPIFINSAQAKDANGCIDFR